MTGSTLFVWALTCSIWSTVWLFIKLGVRDVPPATFATLRIAIAVSVLVPLTLAQRLPLPRRGQDWLLITSTGFVLLGVNYALLNWGMQFISSGLSAVLQAMTPVFGFVFAHLLLNDEKMTLDKGAALLIGVGGVGAIFWDQFDTGTSRALQGSIAVVASAICVAISYVVMRGRGKDLHPSIITAGQMTAALGPLLLYAAAVEGNPLATRWSTTALISALYLALVGSIAGAWLNYWLLKRIGATKLLSMGLIEPLVAVLLGAAILGEQMSTRTILGGFCILLSVAIVLDLGARPGAPAGPPSRRRRFGEVSPQPEAEAEAERGEGVPAPASAKASARSRQSSRGVLASEGGSDGDGGPAGRSPPSRHSPKT